MTLAHRFFWFAPAPGEGSNRTGRHGKRAAAPAEHQSSESAGNPEDLQLVARIQLGDVEVFQTVYRRHYESAVKFAYRFVHSREAAQDLAQDVFAMVWERRESLHVYGDLRTYLLTAVRHRALDVIRHERLADRATEVTEVTEPTEQESVLGMGSVPPTDVAAEEAVLLAALIRVVAALPERQRTALLLRREQGLTNREIARVLGVGEAAVSRLLSRTAETLLREFFG